MRVAYLLLGPVFVAVGVGTMRLREGVEKVDKKIAATLFRSPEGRLSDRSRRLYTYARGCLLVVVGVVLLLIGLGLLAPY